MHVAAAVIALACMTAMGCTYHECPNGGTCCYKTVAEEQCTCAKPMECGGGTFTDRVCSNDTPTQKQNNAQSACNATCPKDSMGNLVARCTGCTCTSTSESCQVEYGCR